MYVKLLQLTQTVIDNFHSDLFMYGHTRFHFVWWGFCYWDSDGLLKVTGREVGLLNHITLYVPPSTVILNTDMVVMQASKAASPETFGYTRTHISFWWYFVEYEITWLSGGTSYKYMKGFTLCKIVKLVESMELTLYEVVSKGFGRSQ